MLPRQLPMKLGLPPTTAVCLLTADVKRVWVGYRRMVRVFGPDGASVFRQAMRNAVKKLRRETSPGSYRGRR